MRSFIPSRLLRASAIVSVSLLAFVMSQNSVKAVSASDWNAGNIISDSLFFDYSSMSVSEIQSFLNQRVSSCDRNGTKASEYGGGTRAQYGASKGYPAPYTCLKDYYENPTTHENNLSGNPVPSGGRSAAQLIWDVSQQYQVSPKVLIVTLQKESLNLLNDEWPWPSQYKVPMGYGCPDSAPCDSQYFGFYNQISKAAYQFRRYATYPADYRYKAGQVNSIQYNPNVSCGSSNVYIENQATAGLYNYTPYQPNQGALNAGYGEASCGAYGNRNFWLYYNSWFGSTQAGDLVRTANNPTVYLIVDESKYPIADSNVYNDFSALGPLRFVSDAYVSSKTTGPTLGHLVGGPTDTLYFVNAGIKLPFTSCTLVSDYGYACENIIHLSQEQIDKLSTGPSLTRRYKTTSGKDFYVVGGEKREVFDTQSLTAQSLSTSSVTLNELGINYVPYGLPIIRSGVVVNNRNTGSQYYYDNNKYLWLDNDIRSLPTFTAMVKRSLDDYSVPTGQRVTGFNGFVRNTNSSAFYILTPSGRATLSDSSQWPVNFEVSDSLSGSSPTSSTSSVNNYLIKSSNASSVYYVNGGKKRPVSSWDDLLSLNIKPLVINTLNPTSVAAIPSGGSFLGIGKLVKTVNSNTVYIVGDETNLYPISSFVFAEEMGLSTKVSTVSQATFQQYTIGSTINNKFGCGGQYYITTLGARHNISSADISNYGYTTGDFLSVRLKLCTVIRFDSQDMQRNIRLGDGRIYYIENGFKRPISSYNTYINRGGNSSNTINVSYHLANSLPTGANITN